MTVPTNPPPVKIPDKLFNDPDPEVRDFLLQFTRAVYFMWEQQKDHETRITTLEP